MDYRSQESKNGEWCFKTVPDDQFLFPSICEEGLLVFQKRIHFLFSDFRLAVSLVITVDCGGYVVCILVMPQFARLVRGVRR